MRGLFRWAHKAGHVKQDPTAGVERTARPRNEGFKAWDEADVSVYEQRWPLGTRQRVGLDVLLYTGLRRGDAARIGRQHIRDGVAYLKTEKTDTQVALPIPPALVQTLAAGPCGDLSFIAGVRGRPMTKESFGNGIPRCLPRRGHQQVSAWAAQDCGYQVRAERSDGAADECNLWLDRSKDGAALH